MYSQLLFVALSLYVPLSLRLFHFENKIGFFLLVFFYSVCFRCLLICVRACIVRFLHWNYLLRAHNIRSFHSCFVLLLRLLLLLLPFFTSNYRIGSLYSHLFDDCYFIFLAECLRVFIVSIFNFFLSFCLFSLLSFIIQHSF